MIPLPHWFSSSRLAANPFSAFVPVLAESVLTSAVSFQPLGDPWIVSSVITESNQLRPDSVSALLGIEGLQK